MKKVLFVLLIISFSKTFSQTKNPFVYTNGDVKIELVMADKRNVLIANKDNLVTMRFENLDPKTLTCSAPGLRILKGASPERNEVLWSISLVDNPTPRGIYKLFFTYKVKGKAFSEMFEIPVVDE